MSACALCGTPARAPFRAPPAEMAPDLDGRPGEPTRSTLADWLIACAGCGVVAPDLAAVPTSARAVIGSEAYRALDMVHPLAARPFLRWAMIAAATGAPDEAAEAHLQAAWAADDAGDAEAARTQRLEAAALWESRAAVEDGLAQRLVDVLRRASAFDRAARLAGDLESRAADPDTARIARFELARIGAGDAGRYTIASALPPPARSPHVAHGRRPAAPPRKSGFLERLFGRL